MRLHKNLLQLFVFLAAVSISTPLFATVGNWTTTGSLNIPRGFHVQALLFDGRVLAAGGTTATGPTNTAEIYSPTTGLWTLTANMMTARTSASGLTLPNGKVLVAGGVTSGGSVVATTEIFDPATNTWSAGPTMLSARTNFAMVTLSSGRVLALGGCGTSVCVTSGVVSPDPLKSAEVYSATLNTWLPTGAMNTARPLPSAVLMPNGKVFVTANIGINVFTQFDIYDPATGTFTASGPELYPAPALTAGLLDGRVVAFYDGPTYVYDPVANTFTAGGAMAHTQVGPTVTTLRDGFVLVAGGGVHTSCSGGKGGGCHTNYDGVNELFLPASNSFETASASIGVHLQGAAATQLKNDTVLLAGGLTSYLTNSVPTGGSEIYEEASETLTPSPLTFGGQIVGTASAAGTVTLTNTTNAKLAVLGVKATGDFSESNTCVGTIAAGATCPVTVTFKPTATGARVGALNITLGDSPFADSIVLNGTGLSYALTANPASLSLATVANTKTSSPISVSNVSASASSFSAAITGTGFSQTNNCGATLAAGANCTVTVTFAPAVVGNSIGQLTLTGAGGSFGVGLTGVGGAVALAVTPSSLNFPALVVGDDTTLPITVQNLTAVTFKVTSVGKPSAPFSIVGNNCGTLTAGSSCTIAVDFAPSAAGSFSSTVSVTDSSGATNTVVVNGSASLDSGN